MKRVVGYFGPNVLEFLIKFMNNNRIQFLTDT
jgi:hypothetical protein